MRDSSAESATVLGRLRPKHVYRLLELVHRSTVRDVAFIAKRFEEEGQHFAETLCFLRDIGWLSVDEGRVIVANEAVSRILASSGELRDVLLSQELFGGLGDYEKLFANYLAQFRNEHGELIHQPAADRRLRETEARDFLMELGAVHHRPDVDSYVLAEPFVHLGLWARNVRGPTVTAFNMRSQERVELGRAAELAAIEWERQRVGREWAGRVKHIADEHPGACFDIESVTVYGARLEQRFIEVKAVPAGSFEFHWSRAEVEAAQILHVRYFLYLLPVRAPGVPDVGGLEVIQNPYSAVYRNPEAWQKIEADIVCRRKGNPAS